MKIQTLVFFFLLIKTSCLARSAEKPKIRKRRWFNFWRPATTSTPIATITTTTTLKPVSFTPTPDILGNTVPTGTILPQKPQPTLSNSLFSFLTRRPAKTTTTTDGTEEIKSIEATDKPRNNFANFLNDLGVEVDSVEVLTVKPGTGALGTNVAASKSPPIEDTPSNIDTSGVDIQIAICSYFEQKPDVSSQVKEVFKETLKKCIPSGPTVSPAVAEEVLRKEIQKIIQSQVTQSLPTDSPDQLNKLLNPPNYLSALGGTNTASNPLSSLGLMSSILGVGNSPISSLLGGGNSILGNNGGDSKTKMILNVLQQQQIAAQQAANKEPVNIGIQEPSFVPTPAPRKPNPYLCNFLMTKMQDSNEGLSSLMRMQYIQGGCLNELFSNPLALLRDGALDQIKEILGLSEKVDEFENAATGPIDLSLVPSGVLTECLNRRDEFNSNYNCKTGVNVNIRTEQECTNIGCVYAPGNLCFRCPLIKRNYESNQLPQLTCAVAKDRRQECPGFGKYKMMQTIFSSSQSYNPYGSSSYLRPSGLEGGVVQGQGTSSSGMALLNQLMMSQRSSTKNESDTEQSMGSEDYARAYIQAYVNVRDSIKTGPRARQGLNSNLLTSLISGGGLGGGSSTSSLIMNLLGGSSPSLFGGGSNNFGGGSSTSSLMMDLLGGSTSSLFGGGSSNFFGGRTTVTSQLLKGKCESLGCCYDENSLSDPCYKKDYPTNVWMDQPTCFEDDCGSTTSNFLGRIIFGDAASNSEDRPWQVMIKLPNSDETICTGVIICKQWVLTTASCLVRKEDSRHPLGFVASLVSILLFW